uniref:Ig-like domain-containing protein n=1 Tax=Geospiza parvula TaxID=87175 RepID=A0A8C3NFF8_GEOPR
MILLFSLAVAVARAQVEQEPFLETTEGTGINITCSHPQIQISDRIQWYRLLPGQGPELLALTMKETKPLPDNAGSLSSSLVLRALQPSDSARYFCAIHTETGNPAELEHKPPGAWHGVC